MENYYSIKTDPFLKDLLNSYSPSGFEYSATKIFDNYCSLFSKDKTPIRDVMGNHTFKIIEGGGVSSEKILLSGHIDEIGFMVSDISDIGMISVIPLGGVDKKVLPGSEIVFLTDKNTEVIGIIGKVPIHLESDEDRNSISKIEDTIIDIGAESKEEVLNLGINIGTFASFKNNFIPDFGKFRFMSKGLDDKIGVYVVSRACWELSNTFDKSIFGNKTIYCSSITQEELGLRGAKSLSQGMLDTSFISIDVDVTFASDEDRGIKRSDSGNIKLGSGPVIDFGPDKRLSRFLMKVAKDNSIPFQIAASYPDGTNTGAYQTNGFGSLTSLISIPVRNMHTQVEVCDYRDVESAINLIYHSVIDMCSKEDFIKDFIV